MYYEKCPEKQCTDDYTAGAERCLIERVTDHSSNDGKSHLFKHFVQTKHKTVSSEVFKVTGKGHKSQNFNVD